MQDTNSTINEQENQERWLLFQGNTVLVVNDGSPFPFPQDLNEINVSPDNIINLGEYKGYSIIGATITDFDSNDSYQLTDFRKLYGIVNLEDIWFIGNSFQRVKFEQEHKYCGKCGVITNNHKTESAKVCPNCGLMVYSKISPAVIMAVTKGDEILLAHSGQFQEKLFSVLAGFVEPGETLEQCVQREVMEEVGIEVKNINYFGSQPWPFSSSLMIAYTAEYDSGVITIDEDEIVEADWYKYDDLPMIPGTISIARRLIDSFVHSRQRK